MEKKLMNAFSYAISAGNIEMFDLLAKDFDKFNQDDKDELLTRTVMDSADTDFIQHVLNYGYDINYVDDLKNTLLHYASVSSNPETVRFFINKGLDIEAKNESDRTPLAVSVRETDNIEVIKILVDSGAKLDVRFDGNENLLIAAAGNNPNVEITKWLLRKGFDIEERDDDGFTPLLNAVYHQENLDVIIFLVESGANIHAKTKRGKNIFHLSAHNDNSSIASYISEAFLTSSVDNDGYNCMDEALLYSSSPDVINVYLRKMKLEQVFSAACNENPEILEALIHSGYDANTVDGDGITALMMAAKNNSNVDMIRMLVHYGAIIEAEDKHGRSVLHYAASNPDPAIYDWMLKENAFNFFVNVKDEYENTPEYYKSNPDKF